MEWRLIPDLHDACFWVESRRVVPVARRTANIEVHQVIDPQIFQWRIAYVRRPMAHQQEGPVESPQGDIEHGHWDCLTLWSVFQS